ncbi:MAG: phosphoglycerate dehydrogenase [Spirochaetaceae bacterium]|nr:phosphoglycerate dehydrogenase [Spirochaetaceae bacterium]
MSFHTILVTARSFAKANPLPLNVLVEAGCSVIRPKDEEEWRELLAEADGIIAGLERYDEDTLHSCKKLKVISRYGVGCDAIDLNAARKKGVKVACTPEANSDSVADLAIALMLAAARHIPYMDAMVKTGVAERPLGVEMCRKTLGVIGAGRIGKRVMKRASGFDMRLLCYDVRRDDEAVLRLGGAYTNLDALCTESDFITIHLPLTGETRGMISENQFKKMKRTAVIVNTARGGIVDEGALYHALKTGGIFAAGLDVSVYEPPCGSPLCTLPNCIVSPHIGAATIEATHSMGMMAVENLLTVLETGTCPYLA